MTSKAWSLGTREMDAGGACTAARSGIAKRGGGPWNGAAEAQRERGGTIYPGWQGGVHFLGGWPQGDLDKAIGAGFAPLYPFH